MFVADVPISQGFWSTPHAHILLMNRVSSRTRIADVLLKAIVYPQTALSPDIPNEVRKALTARQAFRWCQGHRRKSPLPLEAKPSSLLPAAMRTAVPLFTILFSMSQVPPGNRINPAEAVVRAECLDLPGIQDSEQKPPTCARGGVS